VPKSTGNPRLSPATYALLGLLAIRSWTGYELTEQARRSLRFLWPTSEGHLYREQKRLVTLGWAKSTEETVGQRARSRYSITAAGRRALTKWTETEPLPPAYEVDGIVRIFFGDQSSPDALRSSMATTADQARSQIDDLLEFVDDYLETGGPFPERLHVIALAVEVLTDMMSALEDFSRRAAAEVGTWDTTRGRGLDADTRTRLERIRDKHRSAVSRSGPG
jgi:PadR family transcriptional regulator, regulatory protein AphA